MSVLQGEEMSAFQKEIEGAARMINELDSHQLEVFVSAIKPKTIANILAGMMPDKFAEISRWFEVVHPSQNAFEKRLKEVPLTDEQQKIVEDVFKDWKPRHPTSDPVNHPAHYNTGRIQPIEAIDDWKLGFALGNAVKYIARAAHKGSELEDLKKAAWYLKHRIERLEGPTISAPINGPVYTKSKLTGGGFMCPFCKAGEFKERLNPGQVACVCGATAAWPESVKPIQVTEDKRELCELTSKLMTMTGTSKLDDALRDLELAMSFTLKHEERNPTHLLGPEGAACGATSPQSMTTKFIDTTCKDCRVLFLRTRR